MQASRLNQNLPIIRVGGLVTWSDVVQTAGDSGVEYEHDAHEWVQGTTALQMLADYLHGGLATPLPTFTDVPVNPSLDIDRGTFVRFNDLDGHGTSYAGYVHGRKLSGGPGELTMQITVRVLQMTKGVSYADEQVTREGMTYQDDQMSRRNQSYEQVQGQIGSV